MNPIASEPEPNTGSPNSSPQRPETGTLRFEKDWTGVFIRGDDAFHYRLALEVLLKGEPDIASTMLARYAAGALLQLLEASEEKPGSVADQELKPFTECLK